MARRGRCGCRPGELARTLSHGRCARRDQLRRGAGSLAARARSARWGDRRGRECATAHPQPVGADCPTVALLSPPRRYRGMRSPDASSSPSLDGPAFFVFFSRSTAPAPLFLVAPSLLWLDVRLTLFRHPTNRDFRHVPGTVGTPPAEVRAVRVLRALAFRAPTPSRRAARRLQRLDAAPPWRPRALRRQRSRSTCCTDNGRDTGGDVNMPAGRPSSHRPGGRPRHGRRAVCAGDRRSGTRTTTRRWRPPRRRRRLRHRGGDQGRIDAGRPPSVSRRNTERSQEAQTARGHRGDGGRARHYGPR